MLDTYKAVMYTQRSHCFCNIHTSDDGPRLRMKVRENQLIRFCTYLIAWKLVGDLRFHDIL